MSILLRWLLYWTVQWKQVQNCKRFFLKNRKTETAESERRFIKVQPCAWAGGGFNTLCKLTASPQSADSLCFVFNFFASFLSTPYDADLDFPPRLASMHYCTVAVETKAGCDRCDRAGISLFSGPITILGLQVIRIMSSLVSVHTLAHTG